MTTKHPDSTDENGSGKAPASLSTRWEVVMPFDTEEAAKLAQCMLRVLIGRKPVVREVAE